MNLLTDIQKTAIGLFCIALIVIGVWGYGKWEHHEGYQQRADEDAVVVEQQKKEAHNAVVENQKQAESDRAVLVSYYNGLLSHRPKLPPKPSPEPVTNNPVGVLPDANWCGTFDEYMQREEEAAENTAKLLRVRAWGQRLGLKPE